MSDREPRTVVCEVPLAAGGLALVIEEEAPAGRARLLYLLEPPSSELLVQTKVRVVGGRVAAEVLDFAFHRIMLAALLCRWTPGAAELPRRVLCLGLGGGALASWLAASGTCEVVVCERHAELLPIAAEWFALPATVTVHVGEVLALLLGPPPHAVFDVIFVDLSAPADAWFAAPGARLVEPDALRALRGLASRMVVLNVLSAKDGGSDAVDALLGRLREVFAAVRTWPPPLDTVPGMAPRAASSAESNLLVFCSTDAAAAAAHAERFMADVIAALADAPAEAVTDEAALLAIAAASAHGRDVEMGRAHR
jgi:spermidine synthase